MNFTTSCEVPFMFRYGSSVIVCLTRSDGRTLANRFNVVIQPNTFLLSDPSRRMIAFTRPSVSCWQALMTSFGGSFFGAFGLRSVKSLSSFGVNI